MNIGFFCYSPASINSLLPLIYHHETFCTPLVHFSSDKAKVLFSQHESFAGFNFSIIEEFNEFVHSSDVIFQGTGSVGYPEIGFNERVKEIKKEVVVVAIHDIFWSTPENIKMRYTSPPDYLIVCSQKEKKEIPTLVDIPYENIFTFGNPHYERLHTVSFDEDRGPLSVSFISQCDVGPTYSEPTSAANKDVILSLVGMKKKGFIRDLVIYKHPRENTDFFDEHNIPISNTNEFSDMLRSEYIISNGSTPHYEAALLGKKNLFIANGELSFRLLNKETDEVSLEIPNKCVSKIYNWLFEFYF